MPRALGPSLAQLHHSYAGPGIASGSPGTLPIPAKPQLCWSWQGLGARLGPLQPSYTTVVLVRAGPWGAPGLHIFKHKFINIKSFSLVNLSFSSLSSLYYYDPSTLSLQFCLKANLVNCHFWHVGQPFLLHFHNNSNVD